MPIFAVNTQRRSAPDPLVQSPLRSPVATGVGLGSDRHHRRHVRWRESDEHLGAAGSRHAASSEDCRGHNRTSHPDGQ